MSPLRKRLARDFRAAVARGYVRAVAANRDPSWIISEACLPLMGIAAYVFVYRASGAPPAYEGFAVLGGAMTAYWMNVLWSMGTQLYWERDSGNLALYITAPASRVALLTGMAVGGAIMASLRAFAIILGGSLVFHVHYVPEHPWQLAGVFLLTLAALYALGMAMASLYLTFGRSAQALSGLMMEPVYAVSGLFFPVKHLPATLVMAASLIPLTLGVDSLRQTVFPHGEELGFLPLRTEVGALAALLVGFLILARWALVRMELRGRSDGSLTLRGE